MPESTSVHRDLGRHDAEIEALRNEMARLAAAVEGQGKRLDEIGRTLAEARGGWRTLMVLGGAAAAIGALARDLWQTFGPRL